MTEKEVHQLVEEKASQRKARLYEQIRKDAERSVVEGAKARQRRKRLYVRLCPAIAAVFVVAICLAVVLPIVLPNDESTINRYDSAETILAPADFTLKQFSIDQQDSQILYLDWYGDFCETSKYTLLSDLQNIVCVQEQITNPESGVTVTISVMKSNIEIESFDAYENITPTLTLKNGVTINYQITMERTKVKFEYNGYKYYLNFLDTSDIDIVQETIESMFK